MTRLVVVLSLAVAAVLAASPAPAQDRISISYLVGASAAPIKVIQQLGLDKKHGLDMDAKEFVDIGAMDRAYMTSLTDKDVDNVRLYWDRAVKYGFMTQPVTAKNWYTRDFVK